MESFFFPTAAAVPIVTAAIGALAGLLTLIVSKDRSLSEFRQDWIDELRKEIAEIISRANAIHGAWTVTNTFKNAGEAWTATRQDYLELNAATARIRMRLNSREREALNVLLSVEELERLFDPRNSRPEIDTLNSLEKRLVSQTNSLLKSEWKRVKRGEGIFVALQVAFAVILILAIVWAVVSVFASPIEAAQTAA